MDYLPKPPLSERATYLAIAASLAVLAILYTVAFVALGEP